MSLSLVKHVVLLDYYFCGLFLCSSELILSAVFLRSLAIASFASVMPP